MYKLPKIGDIPEVLPEYDPGTAVSEEDKTFDDVLAESRTKYGLQAPEPRPYENTLEEYRALRAPQQVPSKSLALDEGVAVERREPASSVSPPPVESTEDVPQNLRTQEQEELPVVLSEEDQLTRAQNTAGWGKLAGMFGDAAAKIGTGYTGGSLGVKAPEYDKAAIEAGGKMGETPLANLLQKREEQKKGIDRERLALEYKTIKDANDPASEASKQYASLAQSVIDSMPEMVGTSVSNMSQVQIDKSLPWIKEKIDLLKEQKKTEASLREGELDRLSKEKVAGLSAKEKSEKLGKLSDKEASEARVHVNALRALDDLEKLAEGVQLGTAANINYIAKEKMSDNKRTEADRKGLALKSFMGMQLSDIIRALSGAATTDAERKFIEQNTPSIMDTPKQFADKINNLRTRSKTQFNSLVEVAAAQDKDVSKISQLIKPSERTTSSSREKDVPKPDPKYPAEEGWTLSKVGKKWYRFNTKTKASEEIK